MTEYDDPEIQKALKLLKNAREYQNAWLEKGLNRVYDEVEGVDGDWLEKWGNNDLKRINKNE